MLFRSERGLLLPDLFVPLAEKTALIEELGRQVLMTACTQARAWQRRYPERDLDVCVNVSPRQLHDDNLLECVVEALEASGLPASSLILEITETAMMHDTEATICKLEALKTVGVKLAVDDFGTGYSSLSYLQHFPVDILKIDRAFVAAIDSDANEVSLAPAILSLTATLGLQTIAEGVETATQAAALTSLGCELAQGYYFSRPVDDQTLGRLLVHGYLGSRTPSGAFCTSPSTSSMAS